MHRETGWFSPPIGSKNTKNADDDYFGADRLTGAIEEACAQDLATEATIERIMQTVDVFLATVIPMNDISLVVLRVENEK